MEDSHSPQPAPRLATAGVQLPGDFFPLRLLLQPGGLSVELARPDMIVGRHRGADVRLSLPDISRRHCRFVFSDGAWRVCDLNSLNGVYVNSERLDEAVLEHGDRVRIGSLTFGVDLGHVADAVAEPQIAATLQRDDLRKAS
jgi:pSer/pThr/pTyr-binding forkhead associated (FHA) protein